MMINATLLLQIANFILAYFLLRFLLLNPVSRMIEQEDDVLKKQHEIINDQKNKIAQQNEIKREAWQQCQKYFHAHSPVVVVRPEAEKKVYPVIMREMAEADTKSLKEAVTKLIITKVQNVVS